MIRLDASAKNDSEENSLEVLARFPGGLDFGGGLVDTKFVFSISAFIPDILGSQLQHVAAVQVSQCG